MYYPSLNKLQKTFTKVLNMSRFAIVRKSTLLSKRCINKKTYMRSTRRSGVGNCLFLRSQGWETEHQERKKIAKLPETHQITHTRSGRLSLSPVDNNTLEKGLCRYLSTVTWSSNQGSVHGFRREKLQRLATFDSLSAQMRLAARSRKESRTNVCYLSGVWSRWSEFTAVFLRWIRRAATLKSPTLANHIYREGKPFTVQPIERPEIGLWTTQERCNIHFM